MGHKTLEQVSHFNYLGCDVTYGYSKDIQTKINRFSHVCGTISRYIKNKTRKETQIKLYKTVAVPTLLYGSETQVTKKKEESRIQAKEMKFLRRVKSCIRQDRLRNHDIQGELSIFSLNDRIRNNRRRQTEHLEITGSERLPLKVRNYKCQGRRDRRRPRKRWVPYQANQPNT